MNEDRNVVFTEISGALGAISDSLESVASSLEELRDIPATLDAIAASVESMDRAYTLGQRPAEDEDIPAAVCVGDDTSPADWPRG